MLSTCSVSVTGYALVSPSRARTTITASSRSNGTHFSQYKAFLEPAEFRHSLLHVRRGFRHRVAFAVVRHAPRLEHQREPKLLSDRGELLLALHGLKRTQRHARLLEVLLLRELILDDRQSVAARLHVDARLFQIAKRGDVDVLDLHRDNVAVLRERDDVRRVLERALRGDRDDGRRRRGVRVEGVNAHAHGRASDGQHAPELTAAEDADLRRARQTVGGHGVHRPVALAAVEQAGGGPRGAPDGDAVRAARERAARGRGPGGDPGGRAEGGG
jgi:hypothetical protein